MYLTTSIDTPRMRRLAELPISTKVFFSWEIITVPLDSYSNGVSDTFRGPWVFAGHKKCLYRVDFGTIETVSGNIKKKIFLRVYKIAFILIDFFCILIF